MLCKPGERRGSAEDHLDGDGRRREGRLLQAGQRHPGRGGQRQKGVRQVWTSWGFVNISICLAGSSCSTPSMASSTPAQRTLVLGWGHPSTWICLDIPRRDFLLWRPGGQRIWTKHIFHIHDELEVVWLRWWLWTILLAIFMKNLKVRRVGCAAAWYQRGVWRSDRLDSSLGVVWCLLVDIWFKHLKFILMKSKSLKWCRLCSGITYDISNKHRLGYSEVQLVQCMIDGVSWDGARNQTNFIWLDI